jgi:hypothetical protein
LALALTFTTKRCVRTRPRTVVFSSFIERISR